MCWLRKRVIFSRILLIRLIYWVWVFRLVIKRFFLSKVGICFMVIRLRGRVWLVRGLRGGGLALSGLVIA
jgi:hypothetical protein